MKKPLRLPERFSPEAHALFSAYKKLYKVEKSVSERVGKPYWDLARAAVYSILTAIVSLDDPEASKNL